jgi:hypothetical protein
MCINEIDAITDPDSTENRLRREVKQALKERDDASAALKVATAQRTAALVLNALLLIVLAFAL